MLSQLARVTDTSQLQIEIQNDARPRALDDITARDARSCARRLIARVRLSRAYDAATSRRVCRAISASNVESISRTQSTRLREATALDSVQRNWIAEMRCKLVHSL
jgi:hypothetical protein